MNQEIYTTEYTIKKILSESWKAFRADSRLILLITLIIYTPATVIFSLIPFEKLMEQRGIFNGLKIYMRAVQMFEAIIGIIATMAIAYAIKNRLEGKSTSVGEALKKSLSKWWTAIKTNLLLGIFLTGLSLLLIIPGIIYYVYWSFALYAVVLENKSGKSALDYSKAIVKGRWWKVSGYLTVFGLIAIAIALISGVPYIFLPDNVATNIITDTLIDLTLSLFTVVSVIFFINLDSTKQKEDGAVIDPQHKARL